MGLLTKDTTTTVVEPVPAQEPHPAVSFHLYAPPTPAGLKYHAEGYDYPDSADDFENWMAYAEGAEGIFYGPIRAMTYVDFPDDECESNGYPIGDGPFQGVVNIPTPTGNLVETRTYLKYNTSGFFRTLYLAPGSYTDPPYCETRTPIGVCMLANFPGHPAIPGVPGRTDVDLHLGWNSGANSIEELTGNLHTVFTPEIVGAGAVGLCQNRTEVVDFDTLSHALYFDTVDGQPRYGVMESGRLVRALQDFTQADEFEIRRVGGVVTYLHAGDVVCTSQVRSTGMTRVGCALYRGGDAIQ